MNIIISIWHHLLQHKTQQNSFITLLHYNITMTNSKWQWPSLFLTVSCLLICSVTSSVPRMEDNNNEGRIHENTPRGEGQHSVYVIGDLHGDVQCAYHWVQQTGLVANLGSAPSLPPFDGDDSAPPSPTKSWSWTDSSSTLVFMGDYVDKGPTSKHTIEFVKSLTEQFPNHVTAIMGNHEMELLLDRDVNRKVWDGHKYYQLAYATVHPIEYLNFLPQDLRDEEIDTVVMDALYNATTEIYGNGLHQSIYFTPHHPENKSIVDHVEPMHLRPLVSERLSLYQKHYINAFKSGTELGTWLENRPIAHLSNDGTLFVHGGVRAQTIVSKQFLNGQEDVSRINRIMASYTHEDKMTESFLTETKMGQILYDLLVYRGNHQPDTCDLLKRTLKDMKGITRLAVGHTPDDQVRIGCDGQFLALDSTLGRWIRANGNEYCHGYTSYKSSDGRFVCETIEPQCQGQIVRLRNNGEIDVLDGKSASSSSASFASEL